MPPSPMALAPKYPLHQAVQDNTLGEESTMRILRAAFIQDPSSIGCPDDKGLRPISVAIKVENVTAINTLLELATPGMAVGEDPLGLQVPDDAQETPVSYNVRLLRESPRFVIHDLLDGASDDITRAYIQHKMPACTCGQCMQGWLSPRMRFRLRGMRDPGYIFWLPLIHVQKPRTMSTPRCCRSSETLQFIPLSILQFGVYKPFYIGYRAAFHAIRDLLGDAQAVPTVPRLRQELAQGARSGKYNRCDVEYFLERGGSVKYALDMVVHLAACLSRTPLGDGTFDQKWDEPLPAQDMSGSPSLGSPHLGSPRLPHSPNLDHIAKKRRRSSSVRDILSGFGRKEKKNWLMDIQQDEVSVSIKDRGQQERLKQEWIASGSPGCSLDTQFVGVRYLMGLHTAPRWDVDAHDDCGRREECQLKRM